MSKKGTPKKSSSRGRSSEESARGGTSADSLVASGGPKKPATSQIWKCKFEWVRNFMGKNYAKGETVMIFPDSLDEGTKVELEKYFELTTDTKSTTVTSEPAELHNEDAELEGESSDA